MKASRDSGAARRRWEDGRYVARRRQPHQAGEAARLAQLDALREALEEAGDDLMHLMQLCAALRLLVQDNAAGHVVDVVHSMVCHLLDDVGQCLNTQFQPLDKGEQL
ncbi:MULTISPECIES: hypothetical protein [Cupriavidus]